jgi:hypothetical protein
MAISTTAFYESVVIHQSALWRRLISMEKSSHFTLLAEVLGGHLWSFFRENGLRTSPIPNPAVKLCLQL